MRNYSSQHQPTAAPAARGSMRQTHSKGERRNVHHLHIALCLIQAACNHHTGPLLRPRATRPRSVTPRSCLSASLLSRPKHVRPALARKRFRRGHTSPLPHGRRSAGRRLLRVTAPFGAARRFVDCLRLLASQTGASARSLAELAPLPAHPDTLEACCASTEPRRANRLRRVMFRKARQTLACASGSSDAAPCRTTPRVGVTPAVRAGS